MGNVGLFDVGVWRSSGKGQLWRGLSLPWSPGLSGREEEDVRGVTAGGGCVVLSQSIVNSL